MIPSPTLVRVIKSRRMEWAVMWRVWVRGEAYRGVCWGNLRERYHLEDPGVDGRIILSWIFRKWNVRLWTGSSWFRIGRGDGNF